MAIVGEFVNATVNRIPKDGSARDVEFQAGYIGCRQKIMVIGGRGISIILSPIRCDVFCFRAGRRIICCGRHRTCIHACITAGDGVVRHALRNVVACGLERGGDSCRNIFLCHKLRMNAHAHMHGRQINGLVSIAQSDLLPTDARGGSIGQSYFEFIADGRYLVVEAQKSVSMIPRQHDLCR